MFSLKLCTFFLFPYLPLELQRKIFNHALCPIPPMLLSVSFPNQPRLPKFVLAGNPYISQLQTLSRLYPHPALPLPAPVPILLKKKTQPVDQEQSDIIETVYLRPGLDTLYLPLLETLDIDHFVRCEQNHVLRDIALLAGDIERLSISSPASSPAAQIILGIPELEIVYAVEASQMGRELRMMLRCRAEYPEREWNMVEVPEVQLWADPADTSVMFNTIPDPPSIPWNTDKKALVERHWEEQVSGRDGKKPKLVCRFLKLRN